MTKSTPSDPIQGLEVNILEVKRLVQIHRQLGGATPGRKHNVEVLNKAAIVLLVACWEAFIEDLAASGFHAMLASAAVPTIFPADVLTYACRDLKAALDHREVWKLAGTGWKAVLQDHKDGLFKEYIGKPIPQIQSALIVSSRPLSEFQVCRTLGRGKRCLLRRQSIN